jgi:hypothetical protein
MHENASAARDLANFLDWLKGANFVVGMHYGNENGAWPQSAANIVGVDTSETIHSQVGYGSAKPFEEPTGIDDCRMFDLGRDDMSIRSSACEERPHEGVIVGFTSAAGEYDFIARAAEQPGNLCSSLVHSFSRRAASPVTARRIPVWLFEHALHRIDDFGGDGSTCIEIHVNASIQVVHPSLAEPSRDRVVAQRVPTARGILRGLILAQ